MDVKLLLLILIIAIAVLFVLRSASSRTFGLKKTGGSDYGVKTTIGGGSNEVAEQAYNRILPTVNAVGTSKHIVKYLSEILGIKSLDVSDFTMHKHLIEHKELFELLIIATERTSSESPEELITLTDLRYQWFLPADKGKILYDKKQFSSDQKPLIMSLIDEYSGKAPRQLLVHEKEKLVEKLTPLHYNYKKFQNAIKSKKAEALKRETLILDTVAFAGIVKLIIDRMTLPTTAPANPYGNSPAMNIRQKLDDIDLIALYPREPYLVKAFIERIKKEIKVLEYSTDGWRNIIPLGREAMRVTLHDIARRDVLERETERLREEKNRLAEQIERDRRQHYQQARAVTDVPYRVDIAPSTPAVESKNGHSNKPELKSDKF